MNSSNDNVVKRSGNWLHVPKLSKSLLILVIGCFMIALININVVLMHPQRQHLFEML